MAILKPSVILVSVSACTGRIKCIAHVEAVGRQPQAVPPWLLEQPCLNIRFNFGNPAGGMVSEPVMNFATSASLKGAISESWNKINVQN